MGPTVPFTSGVACVILTPHPREPCWQGWGDQGLTESLSAGCCSHPVYGAQERPFSFMVPVLPSAQMGWWGCQGQILVTMSAHQMHVV